jgi:hypothetical protein
MHPDKIRIATGDLAANSSIFIWNSKTLIHEQHY